jgi:hypothetical protein
MESFEEDDYAKRSPATGFVELSNLDDHDSQQFTNSCRKLEPVVVTTVTSEESGEVEVQKDSEASFDVFPKSTQASIQLGVTLLFVLLLPAAFLTIASNPEYALIICLFWFILVSLFLGLIWVIRAVVFKDSRAQVLHPLVHMIAERIVREIQDFHSDFRQEFLLLTEGPAEQVNDSDTPDTRQSPAKTSRRSISGQSRKPRSAIFRAVVQPLLPLMRRRKVRRKNPSKAAEPSFERSSSIV